MLLYYEPGVLHGECFANNLMVPIGAGPGDVNMNTSDSSGTHNKRGQEKSAGE